MPRLFVQTSFQFQRQPIITLSWVIYGLLIEDNVSTTRQSSASCCHSRLLRANRALPRPPSRPGRCRSAELLSESGHDWRLCSAVLADCAAKSQLTAGVSTTPILLQVRLNIQCGRMPHMRLQSRTSQRGDVTLAIISVLLRTQTRDYRK